VDNVLADEYCSVWSRSQDGGAETELTAPAARLSKSRGVGSAGELGVKDETDVGEDGYDPEPESVCNAPQELRQYQGLRHPELPPASGGPVVSGLLPLKRLALLAFVFDGTRELALGDFVIIDGDGGIERGAGI
jgi:hypothetical protein